MSNYMFYRHSAKQIIYRKYKDIPNMRLPEATYAVTPEFAMSCLMKGWELVDIQPASFTAGYTWHMPKDTEEQMSKASKDRVRFRLHGYYFDKAAITTTLLCTCFGLTEAQVQDVRTRSNVVREEQGGFKCYAEIICRPSQFARFLILREKAGFQNMFKELQAELFTPAPTPVVIEPIDVSSNPNAR